jgi:hypothetical protein
LSQLLALQRYYDNLIVNGWLTLGDLHTSHRYWTHNDPVAVMLQWRILPLIRYITRANIMPSYAYSIRYVHGADLSRHTDREQCKYTVSLLLDLEHDRESTEVAKVSPWPLTLHPPEAVDDGVDIHQAVGEAVLYFGQRIPHSRPPLDGCRSSTSLLMHYVDKDFCGGLL